MYLYCQRYKATTAEILIKYRLRHHRKWLTQQIMVVEKAEDMGGKVRCALAFLPQRHQSFNIFLQDHLTHIMQLDEQKRKSCCGFGGG